METGEMFWDAVISMAGIILFWIKLLLLFAGFVSIILFGHYLVLLSGRLIIRRFRERKIR